MKKLSPKREQTRQRLIEAAAEAIAEKGFRDATLDEIAARAGMTKGAIYDNFRSKDELFVAVMSAKPDRIPWPQTGGSVGDKLAAMAGAICGNHAAQRLQIPLRAEFLLYTLSHPEMREQMDAWLKAGTAGEAQAAAQVFGESELPMSPRAFVVMLQAMIPGLMYLRSQSPEVVTDEIVAEIFAGLARRP